MSKFFRNAGSSPQSNAAQDPLCRITANSKYRLQHFLPNRCVYNTKYVINLFFFLFYLHIDHVA